MSIIYLNKHLNNIVIKKCLDNKKLLTREDIEYLLEDLSVFELEGIIRILVMNKQKS